MGQLTTQYIFDFILKTQGTTQTKEELRAVQRAVKAMPGQMELRGIDKYSKGLDGMTQSHVRLVDQLTGAKSKAAFTINKTGLVGTIPAPGTGAVSGPMKGVPLAGGEWDPQRGWVSTGVQGFGKIGTKLRPSKIPDNLKAGPINDYSASLNSASIAVGNLDKKTSGFMGTQGKLMARAIAVIPIWMALRGAYSGIISVITGGIKVWGQFDEALMRSAAVIHGTTKTNTEAIAELTDTVINLATQTGTSLQDLTNAFYRFGTVGLDFEESMAGMEATNKAALAMMGKTDDIAKVLARSYRLLGHTMDQTIPVQERMELMGAKLFQLWKDNAFEIEGMNESLMQFLPTANTANFTFDETISLLAALNSAAVINSRAGRLLRTSLMQQTKNYKEIGNVLGIYVNPAMESQFEILMRILGAVNKLNKSGKDISKVSDALTKIFGGTRGQEPIKALAAVYDLVISNLNKMGMDGKKVLETYNERVDKVTDSFFNQQKVMKTNIETLKMMFMQGVTGGKNFEDTLIRINKSLAKGKDGAKGFGAALRSMWKTGLFNMVGGDFAINFAKILKATSGDMDFGLFDKMVERLESMKEGTPIDIIEEKTTGFFDGIKNAYLGLYETFKKPVPTTIHDLIRELEKTKEAIPKKEDLGFFDKLKESIGNIKLPNIVEDMFGIDKLKDIGTVFDDLLGVKAIEAQINAQEDFNTVLEKRQAIEKKITEEIAKRILKPEENLKIKALKASLKYIDLEIAGYTKIELAEQKLLDMVTARVDIHNKLTSNVDNNFEQLDAQLITTQLLNEEWKAVAETLLSSSMKFADILKLIKASRDAIKEVKEELLKITDEVGKGFQNVFKDFLMGGDINLFEAFGEKLKSILMTKISEGFTEGLMGVSGIDEIFAGLTLGAKGKTKGLFSGPKDGMIEGSNYAYTKIVSAHIAGMSGGSIKKTAGDFATGGISGLGKGFLGTPLWGGGGGAMRPTGPAVTSQGISVPSSVAAMPKVAGPTLGAVAGTGMLAFSAGSAFKQAGGPGGWGTAAGIAGGVGAGVLMAGSAGMFAAGGSLAAIGLTNIWNPVGWILLAAAAIMAIVGASKGPPTTESTTTKDSTSQIASRIDITNKHLEWVNRNLVALRQELTYILPESAYFSERDVTDRFAIDAQRGIV